SFNPQLATLEDFKSWGLHSAGEMLEASGGVGTVGAFLEVLEGEGGDFVPVPIISGRAPPGGPLAHEVVEFFESRLVGGLRAALPLDGVLLSLHGACASERIDDVEGHLLARVREVVGRAAPVVAALDHHANITERMMASADGLVGHRTQPHDQADTGRAAARLLVACVRREIRPATAWHKIPMVTHQEQFLTSGGPMKVWFDRAREFERRPGVVSVSTFPMQPWLDVAEAGWSTVVITDGDPALAGRLSAELADLAWSMREEFWVMTSVPVEEAVRRAETARRGVVVLSDTGDSVLGGSAGDNMTIAREMLRQGVRSTALVPVIDPEVARRAVEAGVGGEIRVAVGGKVDRVFSEPLQVTARVAAVSGGHVEMEWVGQASCEMGRTALLEVGAIRLLVSELRGVGGTHPAVYRALGVEPAEAKMVVVKTASNWHAFAGMMSEVIRVDSPGFTQSHLDRFEWVRAPRPLYGLDDVREWRAAR
ncbi:MAG: M81 family metallopeptidase, partial [Gemmatimonadetes bacterium]|nr:M81 family metallopeptidase [Gemmatimonadota bacterium]